MDKVGVGEGGGQLQGVNPDCPNAANPFHRCAEYCPVPPPRVAAKSPPPPGRGKAVMNGTANGHRAERVVPAAADDSEEEGDMIVEAEDVGERRRGARTPARNEEKGREEAGGGEQWRAVNPNCPNADNPFHRCAEYCPVPVPRSPAKMPLPSPGHAANGSAHSDGDLHPRPRRRDKSGGSGGLPLYVFLREGSDGEGKKVDPRCPNAPNPFHVCTDHCLAKMAEAGRSSEGGKSPLSIFSRHSRRSSSSSEDGSVKSGGSRKVDPKCPNAANPFHECSEYCATKMQQGEQQKGINMKSPRRKGGKDVAVIQNWKVDPRCPNASNPFHMCAQYCFDHLNEAAHADATQSDKKKGKAISKEVQRGEINPDCANASNPYHQCGEHCKRKGDR
ncbi:hypothetical protein EJB05_43202 [Eragrostis curvula]|uniref:Uncharacterized protein n=1 Tax=Eragrostis curvula TaxID=38414 RepID=A0A5J9TE84_9POAL|nr:hypothetical protein EJB05_41004 [Eragrostis curvula]TVU09710.1 hypothetical protein EJB05_43202 [Eragrostis curvula]